MTTKKTEIDSPRLDSSGLSAECSLTLTATTTTTTTTAAMTMTAGRARGGARKTCKYVVMHRHVAG